MWKTSVSAAEEPARRPAPAAQLDSSFQQHVRAKFGLDLQGGGCVQTGAFALLGPPPDLKDVKTEEDANEIAARAKSDGELIDLVINGKWDAIKSLKPPIYYAKNDIKRNLEGPDPNARKVVFSDGVPNLLTKAAVSGLMNLQRDIYQLQVKAEDRSKELKRKEKEKEIKTSGQNAASQAAAARTEEVHKSTHSVPAAGQSSQAHPAAHSVPAAGQPPQPSPAAANNIDAQHQQNDSYANDQRVFPPGFQSDGHAHGAQVRTSQPQVVWDCACLCTRSDHFAGVAVGGEAARRRQGADSARDCALSGR